MNISYHLTEEEARDGLDGLLPKHLKEPIRMGILLLAVSLAMAVAVSVNGYHISYVLFGAGSLLLGIWFLANRRLRLFFVSRRSTAEDNMYMLTVSPEGWIRSGKGNKVKLHGDEKAFAVETKLTVSIRPDKDHMYVIPKTALGGNRLKELCGILDGAKCPVKRAE